MVTSSNETRRNPRGFMDLNEAVEMAVSELVAARHTATFLAASSTVSEVERLDNDWLRVRLNEAIKILEGLKT